MLTPSDKPDHSQHRKSRGTNKGDHGGPKPNEPGSTFPRSADALLQNTPPGGRSGRVLVTAEKRPEDRPESPALTTPSTSRSPSTGQEPGRGEGIQDTTVTRHSDKRGHTETRRGHRPRGVLRGAKANVTPLVYHKDLYLAHSSF
ncbi:uncharacterized protein LOC125941728 [Dermacentor silvarum]|uniref:uncharacterized protein LOC125941728 n=1 Tax=Dermacentor silvarum TaxID=543639 RepID=UPI0021013FCB|nr:uncharacterized protein LOC125941728 [Dermacentor silvarum]